MYDINMIIKLNLKKFFQIKCGDLQLIGEIGQISANEDANNQNEDAQKKDANNQKDFTYLDTIKHTEQPTKTSKHDMSYKKHSSSNNKNK